MILIAILVLVGNGAAVEIEALKFFAGIAGTIKGSACAQVAQFHTYYGTTTAHFDVLPVEYAAQLPFKFNGHTFLQVASRYHKNSFNAESRGWSVIATTPREHFLLPGHSLLREHRSTLVYRRRVQQ